MFCVWWLCFCFGYCVFGLAVCVFILMSCFFGCCVFGPCSVSDFVDAFFDFESLTVLSHSKWSSFSHCGLYSSRPFQMLGLWQGMRVLVHLEPQAITVLGILLWSMTCSPVPTFFMFQALVCRTPICFCGYTYQVNVVHSPVLQCLFPVHHLMHHDHLKIPFRTSECLYNYKQQT